MHKLNLADPKPLDRVGDLKEAGEKYYTLLDTLLKKHDELSWIPQRGQRIKIILTEKPKTSRGRKILGEAKAFPAKDGLFHRWDGLITLDEFFCACNPTKIEPLLFHELCHFWWDDATDRMVTVGHDFEEFNLVLRKYGDWKADLKTANQNAMQLNLDLPC